MLKFDKEITKAKMFKYVIMDYILKENFLYILTLVKPLPLTEMVELPEKNWSVELSTAISFLIMKLFAIKLNDTE